MWRLKEAWEQSYLRSTRDETFIITIPLYFMMSRFDVDWTSVRESGCISVCVAHDSYYVCLCTEQETYNGTHIWDHADEASLKSTWYNADRSSLISVRSERHIISIQHNWAHMNNCKHTQTQCIIGDSLAAISLACSPSVRIQAKYEQAQVSTCKTKRAIASTLCVCICNCFASLHVYTTSTHACTTTMLMKEWTHLWGVLHCYSCMTES